MDNALCLPIDQLPAFGAEFSALAELFSSSAPSHSPVLYTLTDALGQPVDPSVLHRFSDNSGLLASFHNSNGQLSQARLHVAGNAPQVAPVFSPVTLFMAAALMQVTQRLDTIQETQDELFTYLRDRDKARLRSGLQTLNEIAQDCRFNWRNDMFLSNAYGQIRTIRQDADTMATHLRKQIRDKVVGDAIESRPHIKARYLKIVELFSEYRSAIYTHALSSFLEPVVGRNFQEDFLSSVAERISARALAYRELYTECYNALEASSQRAFDSKLLDGVSTLGRQLGGMLSQTPLTNVIPIDKTLEDASQDVDQFNAGIADSIKSRLRSMKSPETLTLQQGIDMLAKLRSNPYSIASDGVNIFLLPASDGEADITPKL